MRTNILALRRNILKYNPDIYRNNKIKSDVFYKITSGYTNTRTYTTINEVKQKLDLKIISICLNFIITLSCIIPIYIILYSGEINVYMDGQEHTDTAKYLLWSDLTMLIILTYWKLKVKDQTLREKIPLILTSSSIHSAGLLAAPKIYQLHQAAKNANKNGYDLSDQIYIEIRWTIEQITEKVMIEINRLSNASISFQDKELILKQSLQQGKLEQALQQAKRIVLEKQNIIESSLPKENIGWFQWIYNGITWSFTSDAYYAGYILLAVTVCGVAVYYLYQPGTSIPTNSSADINELKLITKVLDSEMRDVMKNIKQLKTINDPELMNAFLNKKMIFQVFDKSKKSLVEQFNLIGSAISEVEDKTIGTAQVVDKLLNHIPMVIDKKIELREKLEKIIKE